jgi:Flp pilus assembly protein TadG
MTSGAAVVFRPVDAAARCRAVPGGTPLADGGNAIVEFVYLAVLMMVPLVYVLLTVFQVQRAAYAASSAAREAGRVFATAEDVDSAHERAQTATSIVLRDSGLMMRSGDLRITCSSDPCLEPGSRVVVVVTHDVSLPLLPHFLNDEAPATVKVASEHLEVVDRYRMVAR